MKTVQLISIVLLVCLSAFPAQATNKVDSLKRLLETHTAIDKAEVLWSIAYELFDVDNPQALFYAERAYHEVWPRGDSLQIVKVGTTYGQLLRRAGKLDRSIEVSNRLLPIARRHDFGKYKKMLLNSLGVAYMFKEEHDIALEYLYESLKLKQSDSDTLGILIALQNIGLMHHKLSDFDLAYEYAQRSIGMLRQDYDPLYHRQSYSLMGQILMELGDYESSIHYLKRCFKYSEAMDALANIPHIDQALAHAFLDMGNYDSAKYYAVQTVLYGSKQMDNWSVAFGNLMLSEIALEVGDYLKSMNYLALADSVSRLADYSRIRLEVLKQEAKILSAQKNYQMSLMMYEKYLKLKDSIYNDSWNPRIRRVQLAFQQHEKTAKIESQASILLVQEKAIQQQKQYLIILAGLLAIILILAVELFRSNRKIKSINRALDERVADRTKELLLQRDELVHHREEQKLSRQRIYGELKGQVNSLNGLINLVKVDRVNNPAEYLEQALVALSKLEEAARKLNGGNK